ncbi:MAG: hypothetical protein LDLANPLL_02434 [Turneriella sp.]|nr:hypothetical protein [Turneriella sp.]
MAFFDKSTLNTIRICLREILVNAIEHRNLAVNFEEKSKAIVEQDYMEFLIKRQREPIYAKKKVYIDYFINNNLFYFRIADEGEGFDHKSFIAREKKRLAKICSSTDEKF